MIRTVPHVAFKASQIWIEPIPTLRDAILAHPTLFEGLIPGFNAVVRFSNLPRMKSWKRWLELGDATTALKTTPRQT